MSEDLGDLWVGHPTQAHKLHHQFFYTTRREIKYVAHILCSSGNVGLHFDRVKRLIQ